MPRLVIDLLDGARENGGMKVYISADIEGVAGCTASAETDPSNSSEYPTWKKRMTAEVKAACLGALKAGATEIVIKDAHWNGRNIDASELPAKGVTLIRGWSGHPYSMMQELDGSFAAVLYVGYHSRATSGGNPLSHTMNGGTFAEIRVNGQSASEFLLNSYIAARENVPVAFLSGDEALCREAKGQHSALATVATMTGVGDSTVSIHPAEALERITTGVEGALRGDLGRARFPLPKRFEAEIRYRRPAVAYRASFYPGAKALSDVSIGFECSDYLDLLRLIAFAR